LFVAEGGARARKAWLAGGLTAKGVLTIDAGAVTALLGGASLLAAGVRQVAGEFARGDVLDIAGPDGRVIARGLSEYPIGDAARIIGLGREAQAAALGYAPRSAMVHRDHLVLV
jgi:glutamate 5-kinase